MREEQQQQSQRQKETNPVEDKNIAQTKKKTENLSDKKSANRIDIKGAITLAATITSFLLVLTFIETSGNNTQVIGPFLTLGIVSFILFVFVERRVNTHW